MLPDFFGAAVRGDGVEGGGAGRCIIGNVSVGGVIMVVVWLI